MIPFESWRLFGAFVVLSILIIIGCSTSEKDFGTAQSENTISAYEDFLRKHPSSPQSPRAQSSLNQLRDLRAWEAVSRDNSITGYKNFLGKNPQSAYADKARRRLTLLLLNEGWLDTQRIDTVDAYERFLEQYSRDEKALVGQDATESTKWAKSARALLKQAKQRESEAMWASISSSDDPEQLSTFLHRYSDTSHAEEAGARLRFLKTPADSTLLAQWQTSIASATQLDSLTIDEPVWVSGLQVVTSRSVRTPFARLPSAGNEFSPISKDKFLILAFPARERSNLLENVIVYAKGQGYNVGYVRTKEKVTLVVPRELLPCEIELKGVVRGRITLPAK